MVSKYVFTGLLALALIVGTVYASQGTISGGLFNGAKNVEVASVGQALHEDNKNSDEPGPTTVAVTPTAEVNGTAQEDRVRNGDDKGTNVEKESKDDEDEDGDDRGSASAGVVTPPAQAAAPTPTPVPAPKPQGYTMAQVQAANSVSKCWAVVSGNVYDLTSWIGQHPGGASAIKAMCGVDATSAFQGQHGGQARPASELAGFKIGALL